ncbi:ABC transporter permease [bacterium]|nr:ABC transporter permease [bacterium]
MNTSLFIAKRLYNAKENNNNYTRPIIRIAILAIALSVAVMILSVFILSGFKSNISNKVFGFGGHINISKFSYNQSYENDPINFNSEMLTEIELMDFVDNVQTYATKAGVIKKNNEILGIVLKGVDQRYNWNFFNENLISGNVPLYNDSITENTILISKNISSKLKLNVGDEILMYFMEKPVRVRKFIISGIYKTGLSEFDDITVIGDLKHIQKLNNWNLNQIGGYEISINNFKNIEIYTSLIDESIDYDLKALSINDKYPQIFDWLRLQDFNVLIILILMLIVGGVNMITSLLIIILEKSRLIGMLKAIGASDWNIRHIFIYNSLQIILGGLFWGNLIAVSLSLLQIRFNFLKLDEAIYFMDFVPINIELFSLFLINLGTIIICYLILVIPSAVIAKISPAKSIKFE